MGLAQNGGAASGVQIGGDLGGTNASPQVTGAHFGGSDGQFFKRTSGVWAPATLAAADLPGHHTSHDAGGSDPLAILGNQSANLFLGGPASGSAAAPTYRGLTSTDVEIGPGPAWNGYITWSFDPILMRSALALTAGTVYVIKLMCPYAYTINTIDVSINTGGTGATALANCFVGIYDSTGTRQFVSSDMATTWNASGVKPTTVTGGYTVTAASYIYIALLIGTQSSTACVFDCYLPQGNGNALNNANVTAATMRSAINGTGKTALLSSITLSSNSTQTTVPWIGVR